MTLAEEVRDLVVAALKEKYEGRIELREYVPQSQPEVIIVVRLTAEKVDGTMGRLDFAIRIDPEWFEWGGEDEPFEEMGELL